MGLGRVCASARVQPLADLAGGAAAQAAAAGGAAVAKNPASGASGAAAVSGGAAIGKLMAAAAQGQGQAAGTLSAGSPPPPPPPSGLSVVYVPNEGTVNNGQRYGTAEVTRGPMAYESAYATKDGKIIEAFDGNHETIDPELGVVKSNRIGEFDPATGVMTEVFPSNWGVNGVDGYDNLIYCYFDRIDSMVVFNNGVYDRTITNVNGSAWKYTKQGLPPAGRPPMYTESTAATAFAYFNPIQFRAGFDEHIAYFNAHCAYSKELDTSVIIGGASSGGPIDQGKLRLSIFVPSKVINSSIVAPYSVIYRGIGSGEGQGRIGGRWWLYDEGRAGCAFLGDYVYWIGGEDPDISSNPNGVKQADLWRANVATIVNSADPMNEPFVPEYLGTAPGGAFFKGALVADPYSNALKLWHSGGVFLCDVINGFAWQEITSQLTEYVSTFGGAPYYDFPHAAFVDTRNGVALRKSYWFGGWKTGDFANFDVKYSQVRSIKVTRGPENWAARSTAPGVLWAHDFSESEAEVELFTFTGGETGTNVDPATIPNVIKRTAGIGPSGGYALRTKLVGATLTAATPSGVAGNSHVFAVSAAADFPDPAAVGPYTVFVGDPSDSSVQPYEACTVTARNTGANTLTVTRRINSIDYPRQVLGVTYNYPNAASFPAGWTVGMNQGGEWRRPLVPFGAGSNGKATQDIGRTNGAMRSGANYAWSTSRNSSNHYYFRRGYIGSRYYWDTTVNPSAQWATTWAASDFTANAAQGNIFEGDEFYLQFRVKVSANMMSQHESKFFYLHNAVTGGHAQIWGQVGLPKWGEAQLAADLIPGVTYGKMISLFTQGGDGRAVDGKGYMFADRLQNGQGGSGRWQTDYPASGASPALGSFCWPGDRWVTFLLHVKFGRNNGEPYAPSTSSFSITAPYPADNDPRFQTTVELKVHMPGWADYKTLISGFKFPWWFGDGISDVNHFPYNPAGLNAIWLSPFSNLYQNTGGEPPHPSTVTIDYAQAICSKKPIACPAD